MIRINYHVYACSLYNIGRSLWRIKLVLLLYSLIGACHIADSDKIDFGNN